MERSKRVHELITALRNEGFDVAYGAEENEAFPEHVREAQVALDPDELMGFFLVVMQPETTDFYGSTVVADDTSRVVAQIQMLGAHFRSILDASGLDATQLVDAMVDEALAIDDAEDEDV